MAARHARACRNEEWDVYALAAGPLPRRMRVSAVSLRVFAVGPIAVIAAAPRRPERSTEESLREQHAIVLSLAARFDPLLPARFGSRMTADRIEAAIRPAVRVLTQALAHVRGRQQMTVRLIGPPAVRPPAVAGTGTAYLAQRREAAQAPAESLPLRTAVKPFVIEERVQAGRGGVRATLFHLVERQDITRYREAAEAVAPAMGAWTASVSGPWPPFAFAPEL